MAKRAATTQMTHDNWDREDDEPEQPGEFAAAPTEEIAQRKIAVARRRLPPDSASKPPGSSIFGGFTGFGSKPAPTPAAAATTASSSTAFPAPSFGGSFAPPSTASKPLSFSPFGGPTVTAPITNKLPDFVSQPPNAPSGPSPAATGSKEANASDSTSPDFLTELKTLNESVISWMQDNFQENPHVNFTPVFDDYKKHFRELEDKHQVKTSAPGTTADAGKQAGDTHGRDVNSNGSTTGSTISKTPATTASDKPTTSTPFRFGLSNATPTSTAGPATEPKPFSFGMTAPPATTKESAPFTFGIQSSTANSSTASSTVNNAQFSFNAGLSAAKPFSFGFKPLEKPAEAEAGGTDEPEGEEEGYEPPKPERVEQVEEDAFYSIRCKLFFRKDDKFVEKGVGNLFLKPLDDGKKTQLLIRADTATGNVLLNIILNQSIRCSKNGKNNVSMICVPHPPLDPKLPSNEPAVLLIRVKTSEDADKLLEEIDKAKSSS